MDPFCGPIIAQIFPKMHGLAYKISKIFRGYPRTYSSSHNVEHKSAPMHGYQKVTGCSPPRLYADANNKLASGRRYKHPRPPCSGVDTARLGSGKVGTLLRSAASCYQHQATRPRAAWRHGSRNLWINSANPRIANSFTIQPHSSGQLQYDTPYQYSVLPRVATQSGIRSTATAILSSVCLAAIHTLRWNYNVKWFYIT